MYHRIGYFARSQVRPTSDNYKEWPTLLRIYIIRVHSYSMMVISLPPQYLPVSNLIPIRSVRDGEQVLLLYLFLCSLVYQYTRYNFISKYLTRYHVSKVVYERTTIRFEPRYIIRTVLFKRLSITVGAKL